MTTDQLYEIMDRKGIALYRAQLPHTKSVSVAIGKDYYAIGVDTAPWESEAEERSHIAHELGHCVCDAFYRPYANGECRGKQEYRADKWAIRKLMPWRQLNAALHAGIVERWALADHFRVTEAFVNLALDFYERDGKLPIREEG